MPKKGPRHECQSYACAIQSCLDKNNYDQEKCGTALVNLYECCITNNTRTGPCDGLGPYFEEYLKARGLIKGDK